MKKTLLILLLGMPICLSGQILKKLKLGVDFGINIPKGNADVVVGADFKCAISDLSNIGFRFEGAGIAKEYKQNDGTKEVSQSRVNQAYIITSDYYFYQSRHLKSFAEIGIGIYKPSDLSASSATNYHVISFEHKWGAMIKTGIELERLRLSIGAQLLPKSSININQYKQKITHSYLTFSVGYFIGGSQK